MTAHETIKEILYGYETAGLIECNPVRVLSYLSHDVIGIGMGEQGFVSSKKEISDIMLATIREDLTASYSLEIKDIAIHLTTEATASLCAKVYVKRTCGEETTLSGFMQSLSLVLRDERWWICALHASPIMLSEETIESYPLKFADSTLAKLKAELQQDTFELMNKNFSGGIIGVYASEPYALYFANDMMIEMLGYEREEFEQKFKKGVNGLLQLERRQIEGLSKKVTLGGDFFTRSRWRKKDGTEIWAETCTRKSEDDKGDAVLLSIVTDVTELVSLQIATEEQNNTILSSVRYGSKIQRNLLPAEWKLKKGFSDCAVIWSPKDVVGGDIYWMKQFKKGGVLAAGDCTGHGIPGALLTMLVVSILDSVVTEDSYQDTARILCQLDRYMAGVLLGETGGRDEDGARQRITDIKDGCDVAVFYIDGDGSVQISASNMYIFVCDGNEVTRIKGQKFCIGEGKLENIGQVKSISIPGDPKNRFYVSSDGLIDQIGGEKGQTFGIQRVKRIILENYQESQEEILKRLWEEFELYRGENVRRDDLEVIAFRP